MTCCSKETDEERIRRSLIKKRALGLAKRTPSTTGGICLLGKVYLDFASLVEAGSNGIRLELGKHLLLLKPVGQVAQPLQVRVVGNEEAVINLQPALFFWIVLSLFLLFRLGFPVQAMNERLVGLVERLGGDGLK